MYLTLFDFFSHFRNRKRVWACAQYFPHYWSKNWNKSAISNDFFLVEKWFHVFLVRFLQILRHCMLICALTPNIFQVCNLPPSPKSIVISYENYMSLVRLLIWGTKHCWPPKFELAHNVLHVNFVNTVVIFQV